MKLIISPEAEQDIENIGDYIARDNPQRAVTFVDELYSQCQQIGELPSLYQKRPDFGEHIRSCVYGRYLIIFSDENNIVRIERVLHGAREMTAIFH